MKRIVCILIIVSLFLAACGQDDEYSSVTTLTMANFEYNRELNDMITRFNENHEDYQIEIIEYQRYGEENGIEQLQREILSGKGPDMINFGSGYTVTDIFGEYTEDLNPYFEALSEDSGDVYLSNVLEAFSYEGGLYAAPVSFTLNTYAGRASVIGERSSWTIEEMIECYKQEYAKSDRNFKLYPGETKKDVFASMMIGSIGNYVDWENGKAEFEGDDFQALLEFANSFPMSLEITEDFSVMGCFANGEALLYPCRMSSVYDVCKTDIVMGEETTYIGYPVVEGTDDGTIIEASELMLAISAGSDHKDIAWEFISSFLTYEYQEKVDKGFPINETALNVQLEKATMIEYTIDENGNEVPMVKDKVVFEGETAIEIYQATPKQTETLLVVIKRASIASAYDGRLHTILLEEVDSYFSGDKTLDETVNVIQGRAGVYIGES